MCAANCEHAIGRDGNVREEFRTMHLALQSALTDLRAILRGLQLPEIEQLSLGRDPAARRRRPSAQDRRRRAAHAQQRP